MEIIKRIPLPSQLDDWKLYERLETENIRKCKGEQQLLEWQMHREEERLERACWQRARAFTKSLSSTKYIDALP